MVGDLGGIQPSLGSLSLWEEYFRKMFCMLVILLFQHSLKDKKVLHVMLLIRRGFSPALL